MEDYSLPYYILGDDAFPLSTRLMKPIARVGAIINFLFDVIYNYRISRGRNVVENSFGILTTRFRIFRRQQDMEPDGVNLVVMACCTLHNFLIDEQRGEYIPPRYVDREDNQMQRILPGKFFLITYF